MPTITFDAISKNYGSTVVIKEFTATVPDKDFLVLLGPSGCGKSTMLRMIAGLTEITSGSLKFDDELVNDLSPKKRKIAFVFQSYALYPHMTVRANIAFPVIMDQFRWWHHVPLVGALARRAILRSPDVAARIDGVASMLELTAYLDRRPKALSGGQRQRVALARSLIREPSVYLLDEPLSNLDAKLRTQMRAELSALHARVQKTFIYVTHDQVEALTMGTRIIVLNEGVVQQYGTPKEIYDRPANVFVAGFIGAPPMNLIAVEPRSDGLATEGVLIPGSRQVAAKLISMDIASIQLGIRAEKIVVGSSEKTDDESIQARVAIVEHLGAETIVGFRLGTGVDEVLIGASATRGLLYARIGGDAALQPGQSCSVRFNISDTLWFHSESGSRVDLSDKPGAQDAGFM